MSISKEKLEYLGMFILATNAACYPSKKTVFPSNSNQVSQLLYISIAEIQRFRDRFFFFFTRGIARLIDLMKNHPAVSQELKDEVTELLNHETLQSSPKGDSS